jgi:hypothetical protein
MNARLKQLPVTALVTLALLPTAVLAQDAAPSDTASVAIEAAAVQPRPLVIQNIRPADQRGLHVFEPPKEAGAAYSGFRLDWGGAFTQQFQALSHENTADPRLVSGVNANELMDIGAGFNNATANLDLNAQLAPGIRMALTAYLSSRHHQETWVKDGYILIDASPLDVDVLNRLMSVLTIKVGHFEIDYGDAHYRRSDNGNAIYNPFVGNLILDAFTTQIGAHVYARKNGFLAMGGVTGGEIKGEIRFPDRREPAFLAKLGYERDLTDEIHVRLTGSAFRQAKAISNTLYGGDRAGSRYYLVMENTAATTTAQAWSGSINPGFSGEVTAVMVNPFVKAGGFELFGTYERTEGRGAAEATDRVWKQYAGESAYRFAGDDLYIGHRYVFARGTLPGMTDEVSVERNELAAGWFVTPNILFKAEWVGQSYKDFPTTDIRSGGKFDGLIVEGVVAF